MRRSNGLLARVAGFAIRKPKVVIALWLAALAPLAYVGKDAISVVKAMDLTIAGTPSARASAAERERFGSTETLAVMLSGPRKAVDYYGPRVVRAIGHVDGVVAAVSPWTPNAPKALRGRSGAALVVITVDRDVEETGEAVSPAIRELLRRRLPSSVRANLTGFAEFAAELNRTTDQAAKRSEVVAAPFLLMILLLIFRSPVAAVVPVLLGFSTILATTGVLSIVGRLTPLTVMALAAGSLMGLALGVDYSLLAVSRFREQLSAGDSPSDAVAATMATAGRTVAVSGIIVVAGLGLLIVAMPGVNLHSAAFGGGLAALLAIGTATTVLPALLALIGPRIERWRIGRRSAEPKLAPLVSKLIARPALASAVVLLPLLGLGWVALGTRTGTPDAWLLPASDPVLRDALRIADDFGMGVSTPYTVVAATDGKPVTTLARLRALADMQTRLERDPGVAVVAGPKPIYRELRKLYQAASELDRQGGALLGLQGGLGQAHVGLAKLRASLARGAGYSNLLGTSLAGSLASAEQIASQGERAKASVAQIRGGLSESSASAARLDGALASGADWAKDLEGLSVSARQGASALSGKAGAFADRLKASESNYARLRDAPARAAQELSAARQALERAGLSVKTGYAYQAAYEQTLRADASLSGQDPISGQRVKADYAGAQAALERAQGKADLAARSAADLHSGASDLAGGLGGASSAGATLSDGLERAQGGAQRLTGALDRTGRGSQQLSWGARKLSGATGALGAGLARLGHGNAILGERLVQGHRRSRPLQSGLWRMQKRVASFAEIFGAKPKATGAPDTGPGPSEPPLAQNIQDAGYLALAALEGLPKDQLAYAKQLINADRGGDAARIFVMPAVDANLEDAFARRLNNEAKRLAFEVDGRVGVGGGGAASDDYERESNSRKAPVIVVLCGISLLFLTGVFRSPLLALKATILNLLVVGTAFGVSRLLFEGPDPVIFGPGFFDANVFYLVYAIVFTISMDYEIFIINRMREGFARTGTTDGAIHEGLQKTVGVITGAAAIMLTVFIAFASYGPSQSRQIGIALSVAVFIDATLVRLILLPATMRLFGRANWWMPGWLDRLLPRVDLEAPSEAR